jgi:Na+/melibiose symporter-like transporter
MKSVRPDGLTKITMGIYGTGHVFNDLAAACWFNYLLYFLTEVLGIGGAEAGGVMLAG